MRKPEIRGRARAAGRPFGAAVRLGILALAAGLNAHLPAEEQPASRHEERWRQEAQEEAAEVQIATRAGKDMRVTLTGLFQPLEVEAPPEVRAPDVIGTFQPDQGKAYLLKVRDGELSKALRDRKTEGDGLRLTVTGIPLNQAKYLLLLSIDKEPSNPPPPLPPSRDRGRGL